MWWGWDAANMASGTNFGAPNTDMATAWRKVANQSNFAFSDGHAKSINPGSLLLGAFKLNPKYFLVNSTGY
jgi:prepilin-type processing-associated H-X9-DG protein